ncbi:MAG: type IV pilin-like G/H family protein [Snowella sp.]|nr:type IV pilin-like G/H family protein [Snowella sp.]
MQTNPLMGIAGLAVDSVQIQWGWALLGIGTLLLFTSAAIAERRTQKPISLKASFTRILTKFKPLEWLILFLICVFILIGVSKINLDHFRPKAIAERELEAKSMIATINRYQKAFLVENDHFANSLAELKLPNQPLHYYQNAELVTDGQDFTTIKMMPISMETQLHSFIGAVAYQRETRSFSVKICQSEEPFQVISAPELNADQLVCASGSNSINSF